MITFLTFFAATAGIMAGLIVGWLVAVAAIKIFGLDT